ncbi:MAG: OmpA family protein [Desulfobacteraceae bacterium]|nr:OmpA family protein [Desulfobacteraceae bacterium]MBU4053107.1 OmpA family protein [Pseudomonadota bacterium]
MRLKKMIFLTGVILMSFCFMGIALAENMDEGVTITPSAGRMWFDSDYHLQDNTQIGIAISNNITKNWTLEGGLNFINSSATETMFGAKEDTKVYFYHIDGLYHFLPEQQFVPFLAAGIGGLAFDRDDVGLDNDYAVNYGAGFKIFPVDRLALRGDLRHVISLGEDSSGDNETYMSYIASLGIAYQFGGVKATPPDGDADGDGVPDSRDKCPNTPAGAIVNSSGCVPDSDGDGVIDALDKCPDTPNGIKVDASGCPLDSDGDGVADYLDKCPDTPMGTPVDASGCPIIGDQDNDGVKDDVDQCPDTPVGATVTVNGCWVVKDLLFDTAKSTIKPKSKAGLDALVAILQKNPNMMLEIQGHTDNVGSLKYNEGLSISRAKAVYDYLVAEGIAAKRMKTAGYAFTKPATSNDTPEGRSLNRRVELHPTK